MLTSVYLNFAPNMDNAMKCVDSTELEPNEGLSFGSPNKVSGTHLMSYFL